MKKSLTFQTLDRMSGPKEQWLQPVPIMYLSIQPFSLISKSREDPEDFGGTYKFSETCPTITPDVIWKETGF